MQDVRGKGWQRTRKDLVRFTCLPRRAILCERTAADSASCYLALSVTKMPNKDVTIQWGLRQ